MRNSTRYVEGVWRVLNLNNQGWSPLASSVLLALMDEQLPVIWRASAQGAADYYFLAKFAALAIVEHPDAGDRYELMHRIKKDIGIINSVAYYAMLNTYDRRTMYDVAQGLNDLLYEIKSAPVK